MAATDCHSNIFVLAHKNVYEPAGLLPQWPNSGRIPAAVVLSLMADVIGFLVGC
jgi:hypothetical protein